MGHQANGFTPSPHVVSALVPRRAQPRLARTGISCLASPHARPGHVNGESHQGAGPRGRAETGGRIADPHSVGFTVYQVGELDMLGP
jgi:hypothetical protein